MAATNDLVKRLIDAGLSFTQMTQAKAEDIVKEMQEAGQLRMEEAQTTIQELIEAGRKNTEELARTVRARGVQATRDLRHRSERSGNPYR